MHAGVGENADAERLAREATSLADTTELLERQGEAYADLGEVLFLGGKSDEAAHAFEEAFERFERKGNLVMAQRVRTRIEELRAAPAR